MPGPLGSGGGGTSVTQVTFAESTAAPNTTIHVDSITAAGATTHADLSLRPKGSGALTARVADNAAGGNKRGFGAVDWSTFGDGPAVASGNYAVIGGGSGNTSSGDHSTVAGGTSGEALYSFSTVGGGTGNKAHASRATVSGGHTNLALVFGATVPGGMNAEASQHCKLAYAGGYFSSMGDAQFGLCVQRAKTSTNTAVALVLNDSTGSIYDATSILSLKNFQVLRFTIDLAANSSPIGANQDFNYGTLAGMWTITGAIRRANGMATTAIVGTPTVVAASVDPELAGVSFTVLAETATYGSLQVTATGLASTFIRWCATIMTTEVGY